LRATKKPCLEAGFTTGRRDSSEILSPSKNTRLRTGQPTSAATTTSSRDGAIDRVRSRSPSVLLMPWHYSPTTKACIDLWGLRVFCSVCQCWRKTKQRKKCQTHKIFDIFSSESCNLRVFHEIRVWIRSKCRTPSPRSSPDDLIPLRSRGRCH